MSKLENITLSVPGVTQDVSIFRIKTSTLCRPSTDDNISELSKSIEQHGLLQPIVVRIKGEDWEIIAGNRRYAACKSLGWRRIACHVVELDDRDAFEVSLIENIERKGLNAIDEGKAFKKYIMDFGWGSITDLAFRIGKSPSYISKRIGLLGLPIDILNSLHSSKLSVSIAEELNSIKGSQNQIKLMQMICEKRLSFREARSLIKDRIGDGCVNDIQLDDFSYNFKSIYDNKENSRKLFNKSILALRIAMMRLAELVESTNNNWILKEILMQHKNMLHQQIEVLIKQKIKL
ncbi:MAG TPA: ParB/RepB/Spo0J family partition protein [Nitrososphaeraceae archaeon]|jgi:ParB family chromosome partitioning protein